MRGSGKYAAWGTLFLVALLIVVRRPDFFLEPRFWAEEGKYYFADAWNFGFWRGLFLQHFGYYAVVPSVSTSLATLFPLEYAPLLTTCCAAVFQLLVSSLVIFGTGPYWDTWPKKLLIAGGIQLINAPEVWLTTICIQYWMCIATFFILLEPSDGSEPWRWFRRGMLVIAGLSSVLSLFLAPLFLLKGMRDRTKESRIHMVILFAAGLLQSAIFIFALKGGDSHVASRFGQNEFNLVKVLYLHLLEPFSGGQLYDWRPVVALDEWYIARSGGGDAGVLRLSQMILLTAMTACTLAIFIRDLRKPERMVLPMAFLLVAVLSTLLSLKMSSSPRYAFAPSAMLLVVYINEGISAVGRRWRICGAAVLLLTVVGMATEFRTRFIGGPGWPSWREEVMLWRMGQTQSLLIWPQFRSASWDVELRHR